MDELNNMHWVYILQSVKDQRYYIGCTNDLDRRIKEHNFGQTKSTRHRRPFVLVYKEESLNRITAYHRELEIKSYKGGNEFKKLISGNNLG